MYDGLFTKEPNPGCVWFYKIFFFLFKLPHRNSTTAERPIEHDADINMNLNKAAVFVGMFWR